MNERRKIISEVMDKECIHALWKFAQSTLPLDIQTEEGKTILLLLALAWVSGAHQGLAFPETASLLLAESDEVFRLVRDTWVRLLRDNFPPDEIDNLVQYAMESESYRPVMNVIAEGGFSFFRKDN